MRGPAEPRVMVCLFDLTAWFLQHTNRFPKNWRVTLGDRIDSTLVSMLMEAHRARMRADKLPLLVAMGERLEDLRVLVRLSRKVECLSLSQYEYVCRCVDEIGRQLGGWIKQQRTQRR